MTYPIVWIIVNWECTPTGWCTSITFANSDINDINVRLNYGLNKVYVLLVDNKLTLNMKKKTEILFIGLRSRQRLSNELEIQWCSG